MTSIIFGEDVEKIDSFCFDGCTKIREVICKAWFTPTIKEGCFTEKTKNNAILKVPEGREAAYKAAEGWKDFVYVETFKAGDNPPSPSSNKFDLNGDGKVNVGDLTEIVTAIMGSSSQRYKIVEITDDEEQD